jgi:hypothetical protein
MIPNRKTEMAAGKNRIKISYKKINNNNKNVPVGTKGEA